MRISDWSSDVCSSDLFFLESGVFLVDAYTDAVAQYLGCGRAFDNDFGQGEVLVADFFQELGLRGQVGECGVEAARVQRSDERRVGKECGRARRYRWMLSH